MAAACINSDAFTPSPFRGEGWGGGGTVAFDPPLGSEAALYPHPIPSPSKGEGHKTLGEYHP